ncbi:MAG: 3-hydroxyacyl-CoA dehydrogenase NAD-binding domain-containing protein [Sneathiellaceae bacterium]
MIDFDVDGDGIAVITWNMTGKPMNVLNEDSLTAFFAAVEKAIADDAVKGVVVASAKKDFVAGADLDAIFAVTDPAVLFPKHMDMQNRFRAIEKAGKPFVAAINGTALGGGLEIALACHYRIAADNPKAQIGLPEVTLGLLPGAGGTQRLPRMIGAQAALPLLLEGKRLSPKEAHGAGIVEKLVAPDALLAEAKAWLKAAKPDDCVKPWDRKTFKMPGGKPTEGRNRDIFAAGNAMLRARTYGNYPAAVNIMSCVYEGCTIDIDGGLRVETRYFINCLNTPEAHNMVRFFHSMTKAKNLAARPKDVAPSSYTRVGILGAGMMGAGIAHAAASAGIDTVLLDTDLAKAEQGRDHSAGLLDKRLKRGRMTAQARDDVLARIQPTADYADLAGCQLVVEAVFEDRAIKAGVTQKAEAAIGAEAIFASNTSTLPISGLAEASARPERFIGLHFFSPVDRMPLVEIIMGEKTSQEALARAMDFVKAIRKTPIVVNDSRGFYTSRVFGTYVNEGLALLSEGVSPALIENAGRMAGMPVGPLAVADEVSLELVSRIRKQTRADLGDAYRGHPGDAVIDVMVDGLGRLGKKAGRGFYDYPEEGRKRLWPDLAQHFPPVAEQPGVDEVMMRLMYVQSVETARCMEEEVVTDPRHADVGSVFGWGFSPSRGGTISQIQSIGLPAFVGECDRLAQAYGPRFAPPQLLRDMAGSGESFYAA